MNSRIALLFAGLIFLTSAINAHASYCCSSWKMNRASKFGISPTTYYPVSGGILFDYDLNQFWNIGLDIGYMPYFYADTIDDVALAFGSSWDEKTAETIHKSLYDSGSISILFKFFPLRRSGFYVSGGYTLLGFGGDFIGTGTLSVMFPNFAASDEGQAIIATEPDVLLETFVHNLRGSIGYRFFLANNFAIFSELGVFKSLRVHVDPDELEPYINDLFVDLLTIPFVGFGIGYYFR